ncbi:transketolase, partial [Kouleothrix aurantiaca]
KVHGEPLGPDNVRKTKEYFGWDPDKTFVVPEEAAAQAREAGARGARLQAEWKQQLERYRSDYADAARRFDTSFAGTLPEGWQKALPSFPAGTELATREAAGKALDALREEIPWLLGGSADLAGSTRTPMVTDGSFQPGTYGSNVIWFGVREHAMGAALNGMAAHGGVHAYGGTFLTFSDYMRGAIRVAALSHHPVTYVFTHDSIGLGEDGPTHQPIEHFAALRAIPNMTVIRPGDANEASYAWQAALENTHGPTALIPSRQKLPTFD